MKIEEILSKCDHTLLAQTATWEEIKAICDDGIKYHTASVCIPASYVKQAKNYVGGLLPICTVIGFPNGYDTTAAKCFMAADAVENGADEVDMVINLGWVKDGLYDQVRDEIALVKKACRGKLLKVIIETACSPMTRRLPCARLFLTAARTISKPPPASAPPVLPSTMWSCSPSTLPPM